MLRRRLARDERDRGTTLIELLVVMVIFSIVMAVVSAAIIAMLHQERTETGQTDDLNGARKIEELLDYQARYANAITTPGLGSDGAGDLYVEWQSGNIGQQQTCFQWRWVPTSGDVQYRKWLAPFNGAGVAGLTSWSNVADGVGLSTGQSSQPASSQLWATSVASGTVDGNDLTQQGVGPSQGHQVLTATFTSTHGTPPQRFNSVITIAAINSTATTPTPSTTCAQVGRS
jgi:prepilin-type N-terminal cleavage/methylation domain-containing protein